MTAKKKPFQLPKKAKAEQKRNLNYREEWENLLRSYFHFWEFYVTITFSYELKPEDAHGKLEKFLRSINTYCSGNQWRDQQKGVLFSGTVERKQKNHNIKNPHIHCLLGWHPRLQIPTLLYWAQKRVGKRSQIDIQDVTRDEDLDRVLIPYVTKFIDRYQDWRCPVLWVPKQLHDLEKDDSGRYIAPPLSRNNLPTLVTVKELCEHIPIAKSTVTKWTKKGEIPYYRIGSKPLFDPAEIFEWLNNNHFVPKPAKNSKREDSELVEDIDRIIKPGNIRSKV